MKAGVGIMCGEVPSREKMLCCGRTFREIDGSVEEGEDAVLWEDVQGD